MGRKRNGFVAAVQGAQLRETALVGEAPERRVVERPYVVAPGAGVAVARRVLRRVLKLLVRVLYLSPVLVVVHVAVGAGSPVAAAGVTVAFIGLSAALFALLGPYLVLAAVEFRRRRVGTAKLRLPFTDDGRDALGLMRASRAREAPADGGGFPPTGTLLRARGELVALGPAGPAGEPLLVDLWLAEAETPGRVTEVADFAVVAPGKLPVVVRCATAPTVIAPPEERAHSMVVAELDPEVRGVFEVDGPISLRGEDFRAPCLRLYPGDEVEVVGAVADVVMNAESLELRRGAAAAGPYREGSARPAVIVVSDVARPVAVRLVKRRG